MYQGASDDFLGPHDDVPMLREADGIDFEGEFGVVCGPVGMGVSAKAALTHIRLVVQINDWSLRVIGRDEMKTGFGFLQAKPSTAFAPVAVTPDIGSGTVSNVHRSAGSACSAERRVIEKIDFGEIRTDFMHFGDHVRMQAKFADGRAGPFGVIDQRVVASSAEMA